jgi:hypothetical protein
MGYFGSEAGKNTIGSGINALLGLGVTAFTSNQQKQLLKGQANISSEANKTALEIEQEKTKQAQLTLDALDKQASKSGSNTLLYVGLGVGGFLILGVVIYAVTKKS